MALFNKPLVSVCVPTFNQEEEITECLEGILSQTYRPIQIILANDCSNDTTHEVCQEYKNRYPDIIKYINQKINKGIIGNTKDCLMAADGKYIAICEGDDYWIDPNKISMQVDILENDVNVSMSHTKWIDLYQSESKKVINENRNSELICEYESGLDSFLAILKEQYRGIRFSSVLFKTSILKKALKENPDFFNNHFSTLDIGIFYIMAYYGNLSYIDKPTTVYRIHNGSVSINTDSSKIVKYSLGVLYANAYFCHQFGASQKVINNVFRHSLQGVCPYILSKADRTMATEVYNLAKDYKYDLRVGQRLCIYGAKYKYLGSFAKLMLRLFNR